jgi:hypothetical protein
MNLAHNGVSIDTLDALTQDHIRSINFVPLMRQNHLAQLWDTIYNQGRVQDTKLKGLIPAALARAQGIINLQDEDEKHLLSSVKVSYHSDPSSGMPPNYETQALGLIQAGFDPSFPPLFHRLESIQKQVLFGMDDKVSVLRLSYIFLVSEQHGQCHLHIPDSALAFVIPGKYLSHDGVVRDLIIVL